MAEKILFANFKGGTGKTTNACMISLRLAELGNKTLLIDLDPQANATGMLLLTKQRNTGEITKFNSTLMTALDDGNLESIITSIKQNLDIIPTFVDFAGYPYYLMDKFEDERDRVYYLKTLIDKIEDKYDYIIFDVPPTISIFTDSAVVACDAVTIVLQTQEHSFLGSQMFIEYLQKLVNKYSFEIDILGILPVLLKNTSKVDQAVLENAKEEFGEVNFFENVVKNMERIKRYSMQGVPDMTNRNDYDMHDVKVYDMYKHVTDEFLERLNRIEGEQ
ncbi:AAA family ATPase [Peptostreptococcus faecalis]|uniref:AAA family ATPase n=1 Tax=Peptostreptococcus faecalis TaxID=2045015 RepID=UPI000C7D24AE|nr:AAA family ATPase [Peptostreptococcus faecalis]